MRVIKNVGCHRSEIVGYVETPPADIICVSWLGLRGVRSVRIMGASFPRGRTAAVLVANSQPVPVAYGTGCKNWKLGNSHSACCEFPVESGCSAASELGIWSPDRSWTVSHHLGSGSPYRLSNPLQMAAADELAKNIAGARREWYRLSFLIGCRSSPTPCVTKDGDLAEAVALYKATLPRVVDLEEQGSIHPDYRKYIALFREALSGILTDDQE